jgi:hypothetical protein
VTSHAGRDDAARTVRTGLLADQIPRAYVYIGTIENLLAGRPTVRPQLKNFDIRADKHWRAVEPLLDDDPIILMLSSLNPDVYTSRGTELAPGVAVIRGPAPRGPVPVAELPRPSMPALVFIVAVALLFFTAVGLGWSVALASGGWLERVALAPALGIAVLILGGFIAARVGADAPGVRPVLAVVLAVLPWVPAAGRWVRARRGSDGARRTSVATADPADRPPPG